MGRSCQHPEEAFKALNGKGAYGISLYMEKIERDEKVTLGDAETDYFRNTIYDQLREEVRLGL